jgi:hypothetical protein
MSKRKKEKEIKPPFPAEKKKKSLTIKQAWPVIFLFLLLVFFILHLLTFKDTDAVFLIRDKVEFLSLINLRCFKLGVLIVLNAAILAFVLIYIPIRIISILSSSVFWILLFFYSGEMYLSIFPPSQGNGEAYISKIWFSRYWKTNKYGFRDKEYDIDVLKYSNDKNILLFVGDSYVAGHGIKDPKKRTGEILDRSLSSDYFTILLGINGIGTLKEYSMIKTIPLKPNVVILSHVANDIEEILPPEESYSVIYENTENNFSRFIFANSRNSVLGDLIYHMTKQMQYGKTQKVIPEKSDTPKPKSDLYEWYTVDSVFNQHLHDLKNISDYVIDTLNARFILVLYPQAGGKEIDSTEIYINQKIISGLPKRDELFIVNATPIFRPFSPTERIVNPLDGHPSEKINKLVADTLIRLIRSKEFKAK